MATAKESEACAAIFGLVQYIAAFLPVLTEHTSVLTPLTKKDFNAVLPPWMEEHERACNGIKQLVVGHDCLTMIDHDNLEDNRIFVSCNASKQQMGAVLAFGKTWELVWPVAFNLKQLMPAEKNYPTHEHEMLAIVQALHK